MLELETRFVRDDHCSNQRPFQGAAKGHARDLAEADGYTTCAQCNPVLDHDVLACYAIVPWDTSLAYVPCSRPVRSTWAWQSANRRSRPSDATPRRARWPSGPRVLRQRRPAPRGVIDVRVVYARDHNLPVQSPPQRAGSETGAAGRSVNLHGFTTELLSRKWPVRGGAISGGGRDRRKLDQAGMRCLAR